MSTLRNLKSLQKPAEQLTAGGSKSVKILGCTVCPFPPRLSFYPLPNLEKKKIFAASNPITCILLTYSYNQGQDPGHSLLSVFF